MTKKDIENTEVVTTEEETQAVTEETTTATEEKTSEKKGLYLRAGALVIFVGIAALILGSIWSKNSDSIVAIFDSANESVTESITADTANDTTTESTAVASIEVAQPAITTNTFATANNFAKSGEQRFAEIQKQQRDAIANNLKMQRDRMKAAFERADKQRQEMLEFSRKSQPYQTAAFQQPEFKQDPMVEIMEAHRAEMMKLMEERRQKFINEMNQARTRS